MKVKVSRKTSAPPCPFPMAFLRTNADLRVKRIRGTAGAIWKGTNGTNGDAMKLWYGETVKRQIEERNAGWMVRG
jgi:hypothetical protein